MAATNPAPETVATTVVGNGGTEALKWLAVLLMTGDHIGQILIGLDNASGAALYMAGRAALPLFAWVMAVRLMERPGRLTGYLWRLGIVGVLTQPVYALVLGAMGPTSDGVTAFFLSSFIEARPNILFTLAGGGMLAAPIIHTLSGHRHQVGCIVIPALGLLMCLGLEMDLAATTLVGLFAFALTRSREQRMLLVGVAPLVANYALMPLALPAGVLLPAIVQSAERIGQCDPPRLPGWLFYAYYPFHLAAIETVALVLG